MKNRATAVWMGSAFGAALVLAVVVLAILGVDQRGTKAALSVTARFSYLLFWLAYDGGAMATLFGPAFKGVARRGRDFGLAFASAHLIHVGLVAWLYRISADPPLSDGLTLFFAIGLMWTYLLALFSFGNLARALGPTGWRILRTIGLEYIAFAFFFDFVVGPLQSGFKHPLAYLPFTMLAILGPILRLTATARRLGQPRSITP